jgi:hypothetical protein
MRRPLPVLLLLSACAAPTSEDVSEDASELTAQRTSSSNAASVSVIADDLRVRFDTVGKLGPKGYTFRGTTNQDLGSAFSWVPDDAFGETVLTGRRTFYVTLPWGYELNSILSGLPLFVKMDTASTPSRSFTARLDIQATLGQFSGASSVYLLPDVMPVWVRDPINPLRYRGRGRAPSSTSLQVVTDGASANVTTRSGGNFTFDFGYDGLAATVDEAGDTVVVKAGALQKQASVTIRLSHLGLTTEDATVVWEPASCGASARACVQAKPASATDFGDCGSYREVASCMRE